MYNKSIDARQSKKIYFNGQMVDRVDDVHFGKFVVKFISGRLFKGNFNYLGSIRRLFADRKAEIRYMYVWYASEEEGYRWRYTKHGGWKRCRYSGIRATEIANLK